MTNDEIREEVKALICFYEKRGLDWTYAVEFTLTRHSGLLNLILNRPFVRPWKYEKREA